MFGKSNSNNKQKVVKNSKSDNFKTNQNAKSSDNKLINKKKNGNIKYNYK